MEAVALCLLINYLFYKSAVVFFFMLPAPFWYLRKRKKEQIQKRKKRLCLQFRTVLEGIQTGISAGYSLENSIKEARKDVEKLYGKQAEMTFELLLMETQMEHSVPLEELLYDLGQRSRIEDVKSFSEILIYSKKTGGNMREILQRCISSMEDQMDLKKEIEAGLAARKLEQRIMSLIPMGIILYMQIFSPDFLAVLYGNPAGACAMTFCLGLYLIAYRWGAKLVEIEV